MLDKVFKGFNHLLPVGCSIKSKGSNICQVGNYRPDISVINSSNSVFLVLESEHKSDRKAFIGAMLHACKFASDTNKDLVLVIVMRETGNQTTVSQVSANLRPYYNWLKSLGAIQLIEVLLISDVEYRNSNSASEIILSPHFRQRCTTL